MKSYSDLDIYKELKRLAIEIHKISLTLPKHEMYEEGSQIRRSSSKMKKQLLLNPKLETCIL
jgi:hypothetical protein